MDLFIVFDQTSPRWLTDSLPWIGAGIISLLAISTFLLLWKVDKDSRFNIGAGYITIFLFTAALVSSLSIDAIRYNHNVDEAENLLANKGVTNILFDGETKTFTGELEGSKFEGSLVTLNGSRFAVAKH